MTREQFIARYCDESNIKAEDRTATGFRRGNYERVAIPCDCGEDGCEGWQMVSSEYARS